MRRITLPAFGPSTDDDAATILDQSGMVVTVGLQVGRVSV